MPPLERVIELSLDALHLGVWQ